MRRLFRDEIDSHISDLTDELIDAGMSASQAAKEAELRFGNVEAISHQLSAIHPWLAAYADWIAISAILLASLPLYIGTTVFTNTIPGLLAERLLIWWWGLIIILGSFVLLKWQAQLLKPDHKTLIVYALSTGFVISVTVTVILDVNNFETTVYNALFSTVIGIGL